MASVNDVGVAGQPLSTPPLTGWQAAVRNAFNSSDVTVDARIAAAATVTTAALVMNTAGGWTGSGTVTKQGKLVTMGFSGSKASFAANETLATVPAGYRPAALVWFAGGNASGSPIVMKVNPDGTVQVALSGTNGVLGSATWPIP